MMKKIYFYPLAIILIFIHFTYAGVGFSAELPQRSSSEPVNIIWDTDMQWDWDDAGALAILNAMADAGEANILGIGSSTRGDAGKWNPHTIDAINTYYNRPDIPIGKSVSGPGLDDMYGEWISTQGFPYELAPGQVWDNVVALYRKLLSEQPDTSVVIVTVGYTSNIKDLLMSEPDQYSDLNGKDLIEKKVKFWSCMGGRYPSSGAEANFQDWHGDTKYAIENFPRPILGTSSEAGNVSGAGNSLEFTPLTNPVRAIYRKRLDEQGYPNTFNHSTWDLIATLVAVRDPYQYFDLTSSGTNVITLDATNKTYNKWEPTPDNGYRYLIQKNPANVSAVLDELIGRLPGLIGPGVNLNISVTGKGKVDPSGGKFNQDSLITLTALPANCYEFSHWAGDLTATVNPVTFPISMDMNITAVFTSIDGCTPPALFAHWPLKDTTGNVAKDISGNHFDMDLIFTDDTNWENDPIRGMNLKLNGANEFGMLTPEATKELELDTFSITLFVKMESGSVSTWKRIAGISDAFGFNIDPTGNPGLWNNYGSGWHGSYGNGASIVDGNWHHIAMTHNGVGGNVFYVDGEVVLNQNWTDGTGNSIIFPGEKLFKIGTNEGDNNLPANIQEIRLYNEELSQEDVRKIMNGEDITNVVSDKSSSDFKLLTYPNPFVNTTMISYTLNESSNVRLVVFDMLGKVISTLVDHVQQAGTYQVEWDGGKFPPGVYYCNLKSDTQRITNKMLLLK